MVDCKSLFHENEVTGMYKLYDMKMKAAVIFLDLVENSENICRLLKKCFFPETEYVYFDRADSERLLSSGSIMNELVEMNNRKLLDVPGKKFIFAFYLELCKTDKAAVERVHKLMEDFSEILHPENASQVGYLICYRQDWEKASVLEGKNLKESIMREVTNTVHAEYLLYQEPFGTYDMQENALVRYLHMLSRDTSGTGANILRDKGYLCAFAFERYDDEAAKSDEKQIGEYNSWLQEEKREWENELCRKVVGHASELIEGYTALEGDFAYWQPLFPRRAGDYRRTSFFFHRLNAMSAPHIDEERKKVEVQYLERLEQKGDWHKLTIWIRNHIVYHDFNKLLKIDVCERFIEKVKRGLEEEYRELVQQKELEQAVIGLYEKKIKENLESWEDWHNEVEENLRRKKQEAELNGKYENIVDCLTKIKENIRFSMPPGIVQQDRMDWLLSKEQLNNYLQNSGMDIYQYPGLSLWKVQLVSVGKYDPDDRLIEQILKKGSGNEGQNCK